MTNYLERETRGSIILSSASAIGKVKRAVFFPQRGLFPAQTYQVNREKQLLNFLWPRTTDMKVGMAVGQVEKRVN